MESIERNDENYITDARAAAMVDVPYVGRVCLYLFLLTIILCITWAYYAVLDEQTNAAGQVIPSSKNQKIQSLEGGILDAIYVKQGDIVSKGQPIVEIDNTLFLSELNEAQSTMDSLLAKINRLNAELTGKDTIDFDARIADNYHLTQREISLMQARKLKYTAELQQKKGNYNGLKKEYELTKPLVKKGLMSDLELLRTERQLAEAKSQIAQQEQTFKESAYRELSDSENQYNALKDRIVALKDKVTRTTIISPTKAQVKQIMINTIGGVISPGMEIMELVPLNDQLLIEAKVKPSDIGYLHPDQKALVKVTAYDYSIHGGLEGKLTSISADTITDQDGKSYYHVTILTDKDYLQSKTGKNLPIIPGMTVTVHILTGKKTVLDYIMKPIKKGLSTAMTER